MILLLLLTHLTPHLLALPPLSSLDCETLVVTETTPDKLTYPEFDITYPSTTSSYLRLLQLANNTLDLAEFYFLLRPDPPPGDGSDKDGREVYQELLATGKRLKSAGGKLRIVQSEPTKTFPDLDTADLASEGAAEVRSINFDKLVGAGILHTKLWVADSSHFYIGSANMAWTSVRQVKELGILGINCPIVAKDLQKLFDVYWYLSQQDELPDTLPAQFETLYNLTHPMKFTTLRTPLSAMSMFVTSSPPSFCTSCRTPGLDGILHVINSAEQFIHIEVMEYFPAFIYSDPNKYWPVLDDALRHAVFDRGVELRLLVGLLSHNGSRWDEYKYLSSLAALDGSGRDGSVKCEVKLFVVPAFTPVQDKLLYDRVNHAKFIVTDKHGYLTTSNFAGSYFVNTGGVSLVMEYTDTCYVCRDLRAIHDRDWQSKYTKPLKPWEYGPGQQQGYGQQPASLEVV